MFVQELPRRQNIAVDAGKNPTHSCFHGPRKQGHIGHLPGGIRAQTAVKSAGNLQHTGTDTVFPGNSDHGLSRLRFTGKHGLTGTVEVCHGKVPVNHRYQRQCSRLVAAKGDHGPGNIGPRGHGQSATGRKLQKRGRIEPAGGKAGRQFSQAVSTNGFGTNSQTGEKRKPQHGGQTDGRLGVFRLGKRAEPAIPLFGTGCPVGVSEYQWAHRNAGQVAGNLIDLLHERPGPRKPLHQHPGHIELLGTLAGKQESNPGSVNAHAQPGVGSQGNGWTGVMASLLLPKERFQLGQSDDQVVGVAGDDGGPDGCVRRHPPAQVGGKVGQFGHARAIGSLDQVRHVFQHRGLAAGAHHQQFTLLGMNQQRPFIQRRRQSIVGFVTGNQREVAVDATKAHGRNPGGQLPVGRFLPAQADGVEAPGLGVECLVGFGTGGGRGDDPAIDRHHRLEQSTDARGGLGVAEDGLERGDAARPQLAAGYRCPSHHPGNGFQLGAVPHGGAGAVALDEIQVFDAMGCMQVGPFQGQRLAGNAGSRNA